VRKVERGRYRVPTLREALELVAGRVGMLVEVKHAEDAPKVVEVIREVGAERWVAVISFHEEAVAGISLYKGLIYAKPPGKITEAKKLGCHLVLPHFRLATDKAIAFAHRLGLAVVAWTVNDKTTAAQLWSAGIDGIATDDVEKIRETKPR
jgi:glycerophosphoryl diester phosphodiesterase